jgi:FKBP-type peptidyl-prolyl cis-trans isomerase
MTKRAIALGCILGLAMALAAGPATAQTGTTTKAPAGQTKKAPAAKKSQTTPATKKPAAPPALTLKDQKDKVSYALGMSLGTNLRMQGIEVDPSIVSQALKDALAGTKPLLTEDEMRAALQQLQSELRAKQEIKRKEMEEARKKAGETNKTEGAAFLAANKSKEGVVTLPSGLQYKIITPGTGPKPTAADRVVCNYRGTLINGTEFDSSYKRGEPATFPVSGVIKAWTEALQLMPVGSKWQLFIPSELAYGERGAGADIGPNAVLIFEVELLSIVPKEEAPKPAETKPEDKKPADDKKPAETKPEDKKPPEPKKQ